METKQFLEDLEEIRMLYCGKDVQNQEIIRSHSLEILISFSEKPELLQYLSSHPEFLTFILRTVDEQPKLSLKALIFLLNISADSGVSRILFEKGVVSKLVGLILAIMKILQNSHLKVKISLLAQSMKRGDDEVFELNESKVSIEEALALLNVDRIRLSLLILSNVLNFIEDAQKEVLQKDSANECDHVLVVCEWICDINLFELFREFLRILIILSANQSLRPILLEKCFHKLSILSNVVFQNFQFSSKLKMLQILRNLSFEEKNDLIFQEISKQNFALNFANLLKQSEDSKERNALATEIVDFLTVLFTSENFEKQDKAVLVGKDMKSLIIAMEDVVFLKSETTDRFQALQMICQDEILN